MSDVAVAQPSATPEPATQEVPINENPVSTPNPIGSQSPERPQEPVKSRRQAIDDAYERAMNPKRAKPEQEQPKAAEAKKGHNQPPEDTPDEKFDLKKRPSDQPRGDRGQFAPRQDATNGDKSRQNATKDNFGTQQPGSNRTLPKHAPFYDPPQRMAEHAKRDWDSTPETVRGEVHRMHQEFQGAYQAMRGDQEAMNSIRPYYQMAQQHGTTLDRALNNYVTMEQKLRVDPIGGLDLIVHNLNLVNPQTGQRLTHRDLAYYILSQTPDQTRATQLGNATSAAHHQIGALHQEVTGLKNALNQMHTQQQYSYTRSAVDQYADSHPRFDELGDLIEQELKFGFDLNTAYQRAERLRPATHAAQTRTPSAQTRPDRSISGSPAVTPSNGAAPRRGPPPSRRDAISNAYDKVLGSH